jgi:hypothetical protein
LLHRPQETGQFSFELWLNLHGEFSESSLAIQPQKS